MNKERNFKKAYSALPPGMRKEVMNRVLSEVFIGKSTQYFHEKKNGNLRIFEHEWVKIAEIFSEFDVNAETGKVCLIQN